MRARMVRHPADYPWSSAPAHCASSDDSLLDMDVPSFLVADWRAWVGRESDKDADQWIRDCTATGRPCGDDLFVKRLEKEANRDFTRKKPGPKPKVKEIETPLLWSEDQIIR